MGLLKHRWRPSAADLDHVRHCKVGEPGCYVCLYTRVKTLGKWPWLDRRASGFGCKVCSQAGVDNQWSLFSLTTADSLRACRLICHERSVHHQSCIGNGGVVVDGRVAPPRSMFIDVLGAISKLSIFSAQGIAAKCGPRP